jgi:hypothetical protein
LPGARRESAAIALGRISTPEQAATAARLADGVVVGSALVDRLTRRTRRGGRMLAELRRAIDQVDRSDREPSRRADAERLRQCAGLGRRAAGWPWCDHRLDRPWASIAILLVVMLLAGQIQLSKYSYVRGGWWCGWRHHLGRSVVFALVSGVPSRTRSCAELSRLLVNAAAR